jgi:hypothetical protein
MNKNDDIPQNLHISLKTAWDEDFSGFILHKTADWWLLRRLMDWTPDGYALIRPADIVSLRRDNPFVQRVCRKEGLAHVESLPFPIDFRSTRTILKSIQKHCRFFIVNFDYEEETSLYLGQAHALRKHSMDMRLVWANGKWDKGSPAWVGYAEISHIQFRSAYLAAYEKYVSRANDEQQME